MLKIFFKNNAPCVLFIDEIEAISQRRESASKNMEHRIVTQLLSCFDGKKFTYIFVELYKKV